MQAGQNRDASGIHIACALGRTPEEIRARNFYGGEGRDETPYGQIVTDNLIERCVTQATPAGTVPSKRSEKRP